MSKPDDEDRPAFGRSALRAKAAMPERQGWIGPETIVASLVATIATRTVAATERAYDWAKITG